ncbi:hypothetical protein CCMSSC00406_0010042 [Pleurotus cornucopiae]|uniref:Uncharacterized protein n=1 Tax=Pleurotus cornucopiae TaxID=5321 RepID=A0ACB7ILM6_PLECO|nr:hypothetical protein CCMSSC00406_0010042 [Pleurotus cornucopiae]
MGDVEDSVEPWQEPLEKLRKRVNNIARNTQVAQRSADIYGAELKASKKSHDARLQAVEKDLKQRRPGLYASRTIEASRRPTPSNNAISHVEDPGPSTETSNYPSPQLHRRAPLSTPITITPPIIAPSQRLSASSSIASLSDNNLESNLPSLSLSSLFDLNLSDYDVHSSTPIKTWNLYPSPPASDNVLLSPSTSDSVDLSSYLPEVSSSPCHSPTPHLDGVDLLESSPSPRIKASEGVDLSSYLPEAPPCSSLLDIEIPPHVPQKSSSSSSLGSSPESAQLGPLASDDSSESSRSSTSPESSELVPSAPPASDGSSESSGSPLPMWLSPPLLRRRSPVSEQNVGTCEDSATSDFTGPLYIVCLVSLPIIGYVILALVYVRIINPEEVRPELLELMQEYML